MIPGIHHSKAKRLFQSLLDLLGLSCRRKYEASLIYSMQFTGKGASNDTVRRQRAD